MNPPWKLYRAEIAGMSPVFDEKLFAAFVNDRDRLKSNEKDPLVPLEGATAYRMVACHR